MWCDLVCRCSRSDGSRFAAFAVAAVLCAFGLAGCAQDVGDVDRTQPDKIDKSLFEGDSEWYFRQTVVDTTPGGRSGVSFGKNGRPKRTGRPVWTSQSGALKRITWDIEKEVLYARTTVAQADDLTKGVDGKKHEEKGIVAAFPIKSHFDVQRRYNASTGEPTNVIVENRSDRPWYKREYMRVDWSTNLVTTTGSFAFGTGTLTPKQKAKHAKATPQISDEKNPYRTRIQKDYIETVTEYVFDPDMYACMQLFGTDSAMRCEGVTAKVRSSFKRIEKDDRDYAPMQYRGDIPLTNSNGEPIKTAQTIQNQEFVEAKCTDSVVQRNRNLLNRTREEACSDASFDFYDRFGFIRLNKATWNEERKTYESGRKQYAARQNIWETAYDDEGDRIPLESREPEPIVYRLNLGFPRDMMDVVELVEQQWNTAFLEAVRLAKGLESDSEVEKLLRENGHEHGQMFIVRKNSCHPGPLTDWLDKYGDSRSEDRKAPRNVVSSYLEGASGTDRVDALWSLPIEKRRRLCAELEWATAKRSDADAQFGWERYGDMRHKFLSWVNDFNSLGWLGVVYSAMDPKTGEMVNPAANLAGRSVDPLANRIADITQYLNGDLSREDVVDGDHVRRQVGDDTRQQGLKPASLFESNKRPSRSAAQKGTHPDLVDSIDEERSQTAADFGVPPEVIRREADRVAEATAAAEGVDTKMVKWLEQPKVKERLMSKPMVRKSVQANVAGQPGSAKGQGADATHQSYLEMMVPRLRQNRIEHQERMMRRNHVMSRRAGRRMAESIGVMMGASDYFKGKPREKIEEYARKVVAFSTLAHEVGHAMGLDHNFAASMDPLNYERAYWKLERLKYDCSNSSAPECKDGTLTDKEARTGSSKLAKAVFGENAAPYVNQAELRSGSIMDYAPVMNDTPGLGRYDQAAINFAYARHVERWKPDVELPKNYRYQRRRTHYTKLPALYGDPRSSEPGACQYVDKAKCMKQGIETILHGREWISIDEAIEQRRKMIRHNTELIGSGGVEKPKIDRTVDYRFCTDGREGRFLGCEVHDWGSNQVEMLSYQFDRFRLLEPFHRYRGAEIGAQNQVVRQFASRLIQTLKRADTPFRYYSFYNRLDYSLGSFTEDLEAAARMGLNFYAELLTQPEPKQYCRYEDGDLSAEHDFKGQARDLSGVFVPVDVYRRDRSMQNCDKVIRVPRGAGQMFPFNWSSEYNYRVNRVGTFIDKLVATGRLFQLDANLTFSQFITDQRASNISYWTEFPDALYKLVHSIFLGDYSEFGGGLQPKSGTYHHWKMVETFDGQGTDDADDSGDPMPSNLQKVYDPTSFDIRMRMLVNALAEYSSWEDKKVDFDEYLVVAATESERQNLPADLPPEDRAVFAHPVSHRKFVAVRASDGKSITYDLVEWANDLKKKWNDAKDAGNTERATHLRDAMENVVAKLNLIRRARSQLSPEG